VAPANSAGKDTANLRYSYLFRLDFNIHNCHLPCRIVKPCPGPDYCRR